MPDDQQPDTTAVPDNTAIESLLTSLSPDDLTPPPPPAALWDRIELGIADDELEPQPTSAKPVRARQTSGQWGSAESESFSAHQRLRWLAAAAAVVFIVTGTLVAVWQRPKSQVIATAELQYEDGFDAAGRSATASAKLVEQNGRYQIALSDPDLPADLGEPADLELWLIEARSDGSLDVQPVGILDDGNGTFWLPPGIDPRTHNIVDISIEPRDGDATHSGRSILRGPLVEV